MEEEGQSIYEIAPTLVHQSYCYELVKLGKIHEGKNMMEVQEFKDVLIALEVLEKIYPHLKTEA
jgi:hypothetical protein